VNDASVRFEQVPTRSGHTIGFAQLNAEKSLNALSLSMIRLLDAQLRTWAADPNIACVVLHGAGEKAFCAGGDVRSLYHAMKDYRAAPPNPAAATFFSEEYRLDYLLHRYSKPLLVWGAGIVLGGGLGLMVGASHRVVTETSRVGMPEITIGLFPDVGASWFLRRIPRQAGLFLALTGAHINAHDALVAGLADHFLRSSDREALFSQLSQVEWTANVESDRQALSALLRERSHTAQPLLPISNLELHAASIETLCSGSSIDQIVASIVTYAGEDAWLERAASTLAAGSPTTAALSWELQRRARTMSLADTLRMELIVAVQCCAHPDLAEGVRALLIDKDNAPRWTPRTLAEITPAWLDEHFAEPTWPGGTHPLADL
jgi:enoyl-CoA hydratase/carnithine racemase